MCSAAENRNNHKTPYFEGLRSFKIIDVITSLKELVINDCSDTQ